MTDVLNDAPVQEGQNATTDYANQSRVDDAGYAANHNRDMEAEINKDREPMVAHEEVRTNEEIQNTPEFHLSHISELARSIRGASPSAAETISDKILFHLGAIDNPEGYEAHQKAIFDAEAGREAERAERRAKLKKPVNETV